MGDAVDLDILLDTQQFIALHSTLRHSDREPSPHDQSDVPQTVIDTAPPADATVDKSNSWGMSPQKVSQHFSPASPAIPPRATHVVASSPQGRGSHNAKDPRMTKTFADFGFGGSIDDTQPVDTQTYMGQSELGIGTSAINGTCKSAVVAFSQQYFVEDSEVARKEAQEAVDLTEGGIDNFDDDDDVSSLNRTDEVSPAVFAKSADGGFKHLKTPGTVSRKRKWPGESLSSVRDMRSSSTKKGASTIRKQFGNFGGVSLSLNMSQLFKQTQLMSSPPPGEPRSDAVYDRPSPLQRLRPTSPLLAVQSSPIRPSTSDGNGLGRFDVQPLNEYRGMKESQESRVRKNAEQHEDESEEDSDLDDEFIDESYEARQRLKERKQEWLKSAILSAPIDQSSSRAPRSKSAEVSSDRYMRTPAMKIAIPRPMSPISGSDAELRVSQLRRIPAAQQSGVQVPMTSSKALNRSQVSQQPSPSSSAQSAAHGIPTQQTVAVQDSQTERPYGSTANRPSATAPVTSSTGSRQPFVQQSQYEGSGSAQQLQQGPSSQIALPETSNAVVSAPDAHVEFVPSSPPIVFSEHDEDFHEEMDLEAEESDHDSNAADEMIVEDDGTVLDHGNHDESQSEDVAGQQEGYQEMIEEGMLPAPRPDQLLHVENDITTNVRDADAATSDQAHKLMRKARSTSPPTKRPDDQQSDNEGPSPSNDAFETAPSHRTPASSVALRRVLDSSRSTLNSPVRRAADIALVPALNRAGDSAEFDSIMEGLLSPGDREFLQITSEVSPRKPKRRRTYSRKEAALREPSKRVNLAAPISSSPQVSIINMEVIAADETPLKDPEAELPVARATDALHEPVAAESPSKTPQSVLDREEQGARAASEARHLVTSRAMVARRESRKQIKPKATKAISRRSRGRSLKVIEMLTSDTPSVLEADRPSTVATAIAEPHQVTAIDDLSAGANEIEAASTPLSINSTAVLALFRDRQMYYHPATCIGTVQVHGQPKHRVRFCDGTVATVEENHIRRLELKVNDPVKVNLPRMRAGIYAIHSFVEDPSRNDDLQDKFADAFGHSALRIVPKNAESKLSASVQEPVVVRVENIYMTGNMLPHFNDRKLQHIPPPLHTRLSTPALRSSQPATPTSGIRRRSASSFSERIDTTDDALFSNMLFAITFSGEDRSNLLNDISKSITSQGGRVLDQASGFDDIFEVEASTPTSPKRSPRASTMKVKSETQPLRLRDGAQRFAFTALISNKHTRKEKYIQALALGLPCIHFRWIIDCNASSTLLPFEPYLLPAGESEYLSGAIKSRVLPSYQVSGAEASLKHMLARRPLILKDTSVLLAMTMTEKRKACQFLAYAAGANVVTGVSSIKEAKKVIDGGHSFDWVFCDDDKAAGAREQLLGPKPEGLKRKRKRADDGDMPPSTPSPALKVADRKCLVQGLILGALLDT